jgi:uncharacterized delta-60 repeat protein
VVQPDGKILFAGSFTKVGSVTNKYIARLNSDGTLDISFTNPNPGNSINSIGLQADGKILIGGGFQTLGGVTFRYLARLNPDGTVDSDNFPDPQILGGNVSGIALQPDGQILIGGSINNIQATTYYNMARLLNTATNSPTLSVPNNTRVQWLRDLGLPEVSLVTFELSVNNGVTWTNLGNVSHITGGWQLNGLTMPTTGMVRARGRASGGQNNGSSTLIEQVVSYTITNNDTVPPMIVCPANVNVFTDAGQCYASGVALGTPAASDNSGTVTVSSNAPAHFPLGTNTVTWTATDPSGNTNYCTQQVIVREATPPTVICPANMVVQAPNFSGAVVNYLVTTNGGCAPSTLNSLPASGSLFPIGTNTVNASVTDACGLSNSNSFLIVVMAPPVKVTNSLAAGKLVVTWPYGVLQAATAVNGPFTNVPSAVSPFTNNNLTVPKVFYRVKVQ